MKGVEYCSEKELYSAGDLKSSIIYLTQATIEEKKIKKRDSTSLPAKYRGDKPDIRSLSAYENAMNERSAVNG